MREYNSDDVLQPVTRPDLGAGWEHAASAGMQPLAHGARCLLLPEGSYSRASPCTRRFRRSSFGSCSHKQAPWVSTVVGAGRAGGSVRSHVRLVGARAAGRCCCCIAMRCASVLRVGADRDLCGGLRQWGHVPVPARARAAASKTGFAAQTIHAFPPAVNVYLPKDRVTNAHQGYGFVEFKSEEDADYVSSLCLVGSEWLPQHGVAAKFCAGAGGGLGGKGGREGDAKCVKDGC